jgi:hypothetical protein
MTHYRILDKQCQFNTKLRIEKYEQGKHPSYFTKEEYEEAKCNLEFTQFLNQISIEDCHKKGVKFERIFKVVKHLTR